EEIEKFKEEHIISSIVAQEKEDRVMFNWLRTLQYHNFDTVRLHSPLKPWHSMVNKLAGESPQGKEEVQSDSNQQDGLLSTAKDQPTSERRGQDMNTEAPKLCEQLQNCEKIPECISSHTINTCNNNSLDDVSDSDNTEQHRQSVSKSS
ncbi:hypothetical protein Btru_067835, partial [Bulinus truncatus]